MDINLNPEATDNELKIEAAYTKCNSDRNRNHDIDDVPMHGPPIREDIPHNISIEEATKKAELLMNDHNLVICRKMEIMKPKNSPWRGRHPTSRVSVPQASSSSRQYTHGNSNYRS